MDAVVVQNDRSGFTFTAGTINGELLFYENIYYVYTVEDFTVARIERLQFIRFGTGNNSAILFTEGGRFVINDPNVAQRLLRMSPEVPLQMDANYFPVRIKFNIKAGEDFPSQLARVKSLLKKWVPKLKRIQKRKPNALNTKRTRTRREPTDRNTTNASNEAFVQAVRGASLGMTSDKIALIRQGALNVYSTMFPVDYMLGDQFVVGQNGLLGRDGYWIIIGGGTLEAQGAAGSGEMFFDLINTYGDLVRCKKSEIRSLFGEKRKDSVEIYETKLQSYPIQNLFLTDIMGGQRRHYEVFVKDRLRQLFESTPDSSEIDQLLEGRSYLDIRFNRGKKFRETMGSSLPDEKQRKAENDAWFAPQKKQIEADQKRRADAYKRLYYRTDLNPTAVILNDHWIEAEAKGTSEDGMINTEMKKHCVFCWENFDNLEEGKPVKLRCGHWYHYNCLKQCQTPQFTNYNYNDPSFEGGMQDRLKPVDTLRCIICRKAAIDGTFGDGVYRFVNLRF